MISYIFIKTTSLFRSGDLPAVARTSVNIEPDDPLMQYFTVRTFDEHSSTLAYYTTRLMKPIPIFQEEDQSNFSQVLTFITIIITWIPHICAGVAWTIDSGDAIIALYVVVKFTYSYQSNPNTFFSSEPYKKQPLLVQIVRIICRWLIRGIRMLRSKEFRKVCSIFPTYDLGSHECYVEISGVW